MACSNKWCLLGPHKPISNIYVSMHNSHAANSYESTNAGAKKSLWEWQLNVCFVFFCFFIFQLHHAVWDVCNKKTGHSEAGSLSDRPPFKYHFFSSSPPSFVSPGDIASNFRTGKRAPCRWTKDITKHSLPSTANPHRSQGKHFIRRIIDWIQSFMFFPKVFTDFILEMGKKKAQHVQLLTEKVQPEKKVWPFCLFPSEGWRSVCLVSLSFVAAQTMPQPSTMVYERPNMKLLSFPKNKSQKTSSNVSSQQSMGANVPECMF